jgi:hypothetical protein
VASYQGQTANVDGHPQRPCRQSAGRSRRGPPNTVTPILKQAHTNGWKPLSLRVSFLGTVELISQAGADADGMVITQVVPPYYITDLDGCTILPRAGAIFTIGAAQFREPRRLRRCHGYGRRSEACSKKNSPGKGLASFCSESRSRPPGGAVDGLVYRDTKIEGPISWWQLRFAPTRDRKSGPAGRLRRA